MAESMIRVKRRGYTVLQNEMLKDSRLSLKTKGLFAVMLSLPPAWDFTVAGLARINGVGRDAIRSSLAELEEAGYLTREQAHGERGTFAGNVYVVREVSSAPLEDEQGADEEPLEAPLPENPATVEEGENPPLPGYPSAGEPSAGEPLPDNPTQLNEDLSKDLSNIPPIVPHEDGGQRGKKKKRRAEKTVPGWKPERFEKFWRFYPRHEDRVSAVREWDRLKPSDELIDAIARALIWQIKDPGWPVPYACRYLKNQRWLDEPFNPVPTKPPGRVVEKDGVPVW